MKFSIDVYKALQNLQNALDRGHLANLRLCPRHPEFKVLTAQLPTGELGVTYARIEKGIVQAAITFYRINHREGLECMTVTYAVAESYRKRGIGKELVEKGIDSFRKTYVAFGGDVYLRALVDSDDIASQKIADHFFSNKRKVTAPIPNSPIYLEYFHLLVAQTERGNAVSVPR